jgi:hypothetical protein
MPQYTPHPANNKKFKGRARYGRTRRDKVCIYDCSPIVIFQTETISPSHGAWKHKHRICQTGYLISALLSKDFLGGLI